MIPPVAIIGTWGILMFEKVIEIADCLKDEE